MIINNIKIKGSKNYEQTKELNNIKSDDSFEVIKKENSSIE